MLVNVAVYTQNSLNEEVNGECRLTMTLGVRFLMPRSRPVGGLNLTRPEGVAIDHMVV